MKVRFYNFSKRENSTKQPSATDSYTEKELWLKDLSDIKAPSFDLKTTNFTFDYVYIPDWDRYYFVSDVISINNSETRYILEEDSLASKKTAIGNTVAHIAYSSTGYDTMKVDHRLPVKATKTVKSASADPAIFNGTGCFIITLVADNSSTGMTAQYAFTQSNFRTLCNNLFTDQNLQDSIKKYCNSPFDAVVGCKWVPFAYDEIPGTAGSVTFGGEATGATAKALTSAPIRAGVASVSIPWQYDDFRRADPYTSISVWIPGYSFIDLNASDLVNETSIKIDFMCDCGAGSVLYRVMSSDSSRLYTSGSYDVGVNIPISSITMDAPGIISGVSGTVGSGINSALSAFMPFSNASGQYMNMMGAMSGAGGVLTSGTNAILSANKRIASTRGSFSGRAIFGAGSSVVIYTFSVETENPNDSNYIAKWGRPVGRTEAISNHSGYVQCNGASIDIPGDSFERAQINSFLNAGFYYE